MKLFIKKNWPYLLLIFALAFVVFFKTGLAGLIDKTDINFPLFPIETFQRYISVWDSTYLGVDQSILQTPKLPIFCVWAFLNYLGLSADIINRITFIAIFLILGVGMYYLVWVLTKGKSTIACLVAAIFYMFNPSIVANLLNGHMDILMVIGLMPLGLAFFIQGMESFDKKYVVYLIIISLFINSTNLTVSGLFYILLSIFFIYFLATNRSEYKKILKYFAWIFGGILLINSFWIIPVINKIFFLNENIYTPAGWFTSLVNQYNKIPNIIRLIGFNPQTQNYSFTAFYDSKIFLISSWLLFAITISTLFIKKTRFKFFIWSLIFIFVIFAAGTNMPYGKIYLWLWDHLPGFNLYRDPYKWVILISLLYSILIGFLINKINEKIFNLVYYYLIIFGVLSLILINSAPLLTGNLAGWLTPIKIPQEYYQLKNWIENQQNDSKTWVLPRQKWYIKYDWSKYDLTDIINYLTSKPLVEEFAVGAAPSKSLKLISDINDLITNENYNVAHLLALTGTKYIFLRKDVEIFNLNKYSVSSLEKYYYECYKKLEDYFNKNSDIVDLKKFGKLAVGTIKETSSFPLIDSPKTSYYVDDANNFLKLTSLLEYENNSSIYLSNQNANNILDKTNKKIILKNIEYSNNDEFLLDINIPEKNDYLILADPVDNFNDGSKLYIAGKEEKEIVKNEIRPDGWLDLGIKNLDNKNYNFSISTKIKNIPINNPSFEEGSWEIIDIDKNNIANSSQVSRQIEDATNGNFSIQISPKEKNLGMRQKVNNLEIDQFYKLSFDYKNIGNNPDCAIEFLEDSGESSDIIVTKKLANTESWGKQDFVFKAKKSSAYIYFYAYPNGSGKTSYTYDDVQLQEIYSPISTLLLMTKNNPETNNPEISYQRISPTKYLVNITNADNPYFLNFLQSYNTGWHAKLKIENKYYNISDTNHFVANGFANSWYINNKGNYQIIIEYLPQKLFYLGVTISTITLLTGIIYLIRRKKHTS